MRIHELLLLGLLCLAVLTRSEETERADVYSLFRYINTHLFEFAVPQTAQQFETLYTMVVENGKYLTLGDIYLTVTINETTINDEWRIRWALILKLNDGMKWLSDELSSGRGAKMAQQRRLMNVVNNSVLRVDTPQLHIPTFMDTLSSATTVGFISNGIMLNKSIDMAGRIFGDQEVVLYGLFSLDMKQLSTVDDNSMLFYISFGVNDTAAVDHRLRQFYIGSAGRYVDLNLDELLHENKIITIPLVLAHVPEELDSNSRDRQDL